MIQTEISVLDKKSIAPAWWELTFSAATLIPQLQPGQFLLLRCDGCYLRRPIFPVPAGPGIITVLLRPNPDPGLAWLLSRQPPDTLDVIGPLGVGFPLPNHTQNLLLISDHPQLGPLLGHMQQAMLAGYAVTLALGGRRATTLYPLSQLPPQVEVQAATWDGSLGHRGEISEITPELLRWADVVGAVGSSLLYQNLCTQTREARFGNDRGFLYGLLDQTPLACGIGACLGCTLETEQGLKLSCTDGPVVDLMTLDWSI